MSSMMIFSIWAEGFVATGQSALAQLMGIGRGQTFKEACKDLASADPGFSSNYDHENGTHWGCKLFDNEADARKSFG